MVSDSIAGPTPCGAAASRRSPEQVAAVKAWIDHGAEWPDELAGMVVTPPVDPVARRRAGLIRDGNVAAVDVLLRTTPQAARALASGGSTALMWSLPDTRKMRVLLAADVNVDARLDDRRTALIIAPGIVDAEPAAPEDLFRVRADDRCRWRGAASKNGPA